MKVYLDVCCLSRLFDDQSQDKVRLETEAVVSILKRCVNKEWVLVGSDIIRLETSKNQDAVKRQKISRLHEGSTIETRYNEEIKIRAEQLRAHGVKLFDSLHLASAEFIEADVFLTTDAKLIKAAMRSDVKLRVANPLDFYMEVLNHE